MFRLFIGCLALIGLVTLLVVGGCFGLVAFGVKKALTLPERAHKERIRDAHSELLADLRQRLAKPDGLRGLQRRPELLAIRLHNDANPDADIDLLTGKPLTWRSHQIINGGGVATIGANGSELACLVYILDLPPHSYWIYIADSAKPMPAVER